MERILFVFIATVLASGWATAENAVSEASAPSHFNEATVADLQARVAMPDADKKIPRHL